jgi:hypothetical protein
MDHGANQRPKNISRTLENTSGIPAEASMRLACLLNFGLPGKLSHFGYMSMDLSTEKARRYK